MPDNKLELVVEVDVSKGNASIKSFNSGLSSIEDAAKRAASGASHGIDGLTVSMVKGATAGNLLVDAIKTALRWAKELTIDAVKDAAHVERLQVANLALAKAHGITADAARAAAKAVQDVGYEDEAALRTINRLIVADLGLEKAQGLAKLAKDAAVLDENLTAPEALEGILRAIEMGQERALKTLGIKVQFEKEIHLAELQLGRTLSENEKVQIRYNAVMAAGGAIQGSAAAAAGTAESQMARLAQEIRDLRKDIGKEFVDEFLAIIRALRDMVKWLGENIDLLEKLARVALLVGGALATYKIVTGIMAITEAVQGLTAALAAGRLAAAANPVALLITGGIAATAIVYKQYKDMEEARDRWIKDQQGKALRQDVFSGKTKIEDLRERGMTDEQIRAMLSGRQATPGEEQWQYGGPKLTIQKPGDDIDAKIARLEKAKEQAKAIAEFRSKSEQSAIQSALEAGAKTQIGFAREIEELNAKIHKWTTMDDGTRVALTAKAWSAVIDELSAKWTAHREKVVKENKEALQKHLEGEEEAAHQLMAWDAQLYQQRLQHNAEAAAQGMEHLKAVYSFEQNRAAFERDARLRQLEGVDAQTIQQKIAVEQQKAEIEVAYLDKVHEVKQRLYDMDTQRMLMEGELILTRLGYRADEIRARIAELTQQRQDIRDQANEANDEAVQAARENSANRTAQIVRDHNRQIFDSLKQQAGGVFDALLQKSKSVWSAIGNSLKTALLTAIKDVVTSRVAAMLMQMFTGQKVTFAGGGAGSGTGGGIFGKLGGIFSVGAVPVFGSGGGPVPGGAAGGWGTPPFIPPGGSGGVPMAGGAGGGGMFGNLAGMFKGQNLYSTMGSAAQMGGGLLMLGGVQSGSASKTIGGGAMMGAGIGLAGGPIGLVGGAGIGLFMDAMRRRGAAGVGEATAGGALLGYNIGGPLGALIGAGVGFTAGIVRLFVKGAQEKAKEKIKAIYGIDIQDQGVLKQIVDTAKSAFGGNLDMAIRTPQIRDLIQLYAMSTGQKATGMPAQMTPLSLVQSGGGLYQASQYQNGSPLAGLAGLPSLDRVGGGTMTSAGGTVVIPLQIDSQAVGNVVIRDGRVVAEGAITAMKSNSGRRELTALQLAPGTLVS